MAFLFNTTQDGAYPLHVAAGCGLLDAVTGLLQRGAQVNAVNQVRILLWLFLSGTSGLAHQGELCCGCVNYVHASAMLLIRNKMDRRKQAHLKQLQSTFPQRSTSCLCWLVNWWQIVPLCCMTIFQFCLNFDQHSQATHLTLICSKAPNASRDLVLSVSKMKPDNGRYCARNQVLINTANQTNLPTRGALISEASQQQYNTCT